MIEIVPDVIPADLGEAIEELLQPNMSGTAVVAKTQSPALRALKQEAMQIFCDKLGVKMIRTIGVFELYKSEDWKKFEHHIHADQTLTVTLGLSSNTLNNAGTIAMEGATDDLVGRHNSEVFRFGTEEPYAPATFNYNFHEKGAKLAQAPRFGALIMGAHTLHSAPYLPEETARFVILYST